MNYRALNDLFQLTEERKATFSYEVSVQMMEIYNEQVRDLLATDGSNKRYPFSLSSLSVNFPVLPLILISYAKCPLHSSMLCLNA